MKIRAAAVLAVLVSVLAPAFPHGGAMAGEGGLSVIRTEWFDVIHSERTERAAREIAAAADSMYAELCGRLGLPMTDRFPVSVTGSVESMNAFFSLAPYSLIVVYDTRPEDSMDMHGDTLLSVFYHELAHAVTLNAKSPFWRGMSHFADILTPAGLSLTSFWFEGAAVSLEGRGGGGRLSDPFFTQLVVQARIDELRGIRPFPSWRDVTGARDTVPGGQDAYAFGAMFAAFLQEKYGMERYGAFWREAGRLTTLSFAAGVFSRAYGTGLSDEWDEFRRSVLVPPSSLAAERPSAVGRISREGAAVAAFDSRVLDGGRTETAFFDPLSGGVFLAEEDGGRRRVRRLFSATGIRRLVFSEDGSRLAVTRVREGRTARSEAAVYDIAGGSYEVARSWGAAEAFFRADGSLSWIPVETAAGGGGLGFCPVSFPRLGAEARVVKRGLSWEVALDLADGRRLSVPFGRRIVHRLHALEGGGRRARLSFSWAELGSETLSRAGLLEVDADTGEAEILLQSEDSFAGITDARLLSDSGGRLTFAAVTEEFDRRPLSVVSFPRSSFTEERILAESSRIGRGRSDSADFDVGKALPEGAEVVPYCPLGYYADGAKVPVSVARRTDFSFVQSGWPAFLGATFASANPWTDCVAVISAGWCPVERYGAAYARLYGGDGAVSWSAEGGSAFGGSGFLQADGSASVSVVPVRFLSGYLSLGAEGKAFGGEEPGGGARRRGLHADLRASATLSLVGRSAPGFGQAAGVSFSPFVYGERKDYSRVSDDSEVSVPARTTVNAGATLSARVPGLFPLSLSATLCPESGVLASASARALVASVEIQRGIPALSVFVRRLYLEAGYSGRLACRTERDLFDVVRLPSLVRGASPSDWTDAARLSLSADLAPNTGYFAQALSVTVTGSAEFRPRPREGEGRWRLGLSAKASM